MRTLTIETVKGDVVFTKRQKKIEVQVPQGMYGEEYRRFRYDNKILIKRFKK